MRCVHDNYWISSLFQQEEAAHANWPASKERNVFATAVIGEVHRSPVEGSSMFYPQQKTSSIFLLSFIDFSFSSQIYELLNMKAGS